MKIEVRRVADVRYFGEGHEVQVEIPAGLDGKAAVAQMFEDFHRVHDETFGFHYEGEQDVELVNLRVQAVGIQHRPTLAPAETKRADASSVGSRKAFWRATGWVDCPLYNRPELAVGQIVEGPVIIEEYGSTVVVPKSWSVSADAYGNLILNKNA